MTYLLDTNACIAILNDRHSRVAQKLASVPRDEVFLCQIVKAELFFGAYKSHRRQANLETLQEFFRQFSILPFDEEAARIFGRLRANLASRGTPIGPYDLVIAATALRHGAILVTHNVGEFERVGELQWEDWLGSRA